MLLFTISYFYMTTHSLYSSPSHLLLTFENYQVWMTNVYVCVCVCLMGIIKEKMQYLCLQI